MPRTEVSACCSPAVDRVNAAHVARVAKALADPARVQIVSALAAHQGGGCACDIQPHVGLSQPTMAHHVKQLRDAGLIDAARDGMRVQLRLRDEHLPLLEALGVTGGRCTCTAGCCGSAGAA